MYNATSVTYSSKSFGMKTLNTIGVFAEHRSWIHYVRIGLIKSL